MQKNSVQIIICIVAAVVLTTVSIVVIFTMSNMPAYPFGEFEVLDKRVGTVTIWFITKPIYQFQYANHEQAWIEVREADYKAYNTGDLYPNKYVIAR